MSLHLEGKLRVPAISWLQSRGLTPVIEVMLSGQCDVVGVEFSPQIGRRVPAIVQMHAVELKLEDVAGVLRQASSNKYHAHYSWCAMPAERISKMRGKTLELFSNEGIGLLSCSHETAAVVVDAKRNEVNADLHLRTLWRRRSEWRGRMGLEAQESELFDAGRSIVGVHKSEVNP